MEKENIPEGALEIELKAGGKYSICTCGKSKTLPFCDDSHRILNEERGTSYKSLKVLPLEDTKLYVFSSNWEHKTE